jgi:carbamoyltransferase
MKHILGISAGFHDAATTVINDAGDIVFAGHAERYSKIKNDANLHTEMFFDLARGRRIDHIAYYERPWLKQLRRLRSGEGFDMGQLTTGQVLQQQLKGFFSEVPYTSYSHHLSHAAAGFQTSPFNRATVVVIDAIGEFDTVSIYGAEYDETGRAQYHRLWGQRYPHSIGLFYSAITQRIGLHPLDEEYITMGMSAYGTSRFSQQLIKKQLVDSVEELRFQENLHAGIDPDKFNGYSNEDIAAGAQQVAEELIYSVMQRARDFGFSTNLVYQGGVALNCLANRKLNEYFENIWIMPCPGDAGSSLGAAALAYGKKLNWKNAYLGSEIAGEYPVRACLDSLLSDRICGVASGRAEFGPRALGNRSLLADPRGPDIKDRVNEIKRRQKFRPFAPVILEEYADEYFDIPPGWVDTRYMQVVGRCRQHDLFPAITHVDGTSRIQTVPADGSGIRQLLEAWYAATGCPMLLNTSLNIRGEPMVNDRADADRFEQLYRVSVCS